MLPLGNIASKPANDVRELCCRAATLPASALRQARCAVRQHGRSTTSTAHVAERHGCHSVTLPLYVGLYYSILFHT